MYTNWNARSTSLQALKWFNLGQFINYLHDMRTFIIDVSEKTNTKDIPELKPIDFPAFSNTRFPETPHYLCEGIGNWCLKKDMLNLCVHVLRTPERVSKGAYPDYKTVGTAEIHALLLINQLLRDAASEGFFVTQAMFEKQSGLIWSYEESLNGK